MANPSGRTYHYGEHHPLSEHGGPRIVYRETPAPYPEMAEAVRPALQRPAEAPSPRFEMQPGEVWQRLARGIRRFPIASCVAALGASFLIARSLVRGTRSGLARSTFR